MPHQKRTRESLGSDPASDGDESDSRPESAGPASSPYSQRKRPRTSNSPSEEESSDLETNSQSSPLSDDEELDDDELEVRQTQIIQEKYAHLADDANIPSEHGILERVDCYNFMCHDHFSVELGPLINFITGKNGSGKSAILTALTLCLGGKASATNRGQSLKNFIKEGKENSNIIVRIKNQGDGAYRPDAFGKSIIVERHFTRSGSSGFKIKAENGHIVSTKKAELDAITDYFSLQIDNPMNVLSQDTARQFLSTSSPAEKYKFFVKGVQLEQLDQDYRLIEESIDQIEEKTKNKDEDIKILKTQHESAKKKLELSDKYESLRDHIRNLRSQMVWAQVEEQERARDALAEEVTRADDLITSAEAALDEFDSKIAAAEAEYETAADYALEADRTRETGKEELGVIEANLTDETKKWNDLGAQFRQIRGFVKAAEEEVEKAQAKYDKESQRLAAQSDGGYARRQQECDEAKERANEAGNKHSAHRENITQLETELRQAEEHEKTVWQQVEAKKNDHSEAATRLETLQKNNGPRQQGFHEKLPALKRAIEAERSFAVPPVGPVGYHITLVHAKWSSILEHALNTTLSSFIVTSKRDQTILSNIMQRVGCECPILIGKNRDIDTSSYEPDAKYQTALRVLQIDSPVVRQQLIIRHAIEQMLLIENLEEASAVLFDGEKPRNVRRCFCINERDRRRGHHLSFNRAGDPNQAPVPMYNGHPRMKSDAAAQISAQREIVADLARQLNDIKQEHQAARSKVTACKQAIVRHQKNEESLKVDKQRMEDEAEALREALEKENAEDGSIESLTADLKSAQENKALQEGSLEDGRTAQKEQYENIRTAKRERDAKKQQIESLNENARVAESERSLAEAKKVEIFREKNRAVEDIERRKHERSSLSEKHTGAVETVLSFIEKASTISPRVPVDDGETGNSLDAKLVQLQKDYTQFTQRLGASREEIATEATRCEAAFASAKQQIDDQKAIVQQLKNTLHDRKKRWEIFRSHISSRAKAQFTYLLSERSFRGRLLTDHQSKLLDIQVEPDITKADDTGRGAKTLSGGEKSFSQVCLLLALWEAMGSPIRCLDEFDVYMDHINRRMAIEMLMSAARRSIGRQFILITPGSKDDIKIAPDVKVIELAEPERGQTTLQFQR
ncbi:hypothetical protein N7493_001422, partial [Penicillium malachiteum]